MNVYKPQSPTGIAFEALNLLLNYARAISFEQLISSQADRAAVHDAMRRLEHRGLIEFHKVLMHPILELKAPVLSWSPGRQPPNFGQGSWRLRTRWHADPKRTIVCTATERAHFQIGGTVRCRTPRADEISHDCHVAEVYRIYCQEWPELATLWRGEDSLTVFLGGRIPDALIQSAPPVAIDFGGSYRSEKLLSLHRAMESRGFAYEIW